MLEYLISSRVELKSILQFSPKLNTKHVEPDHRHNHDGVSQIRAGLSVESLDTENSVHETRIARRCEIRRGYRCGPGAVVPLLNI